MGYEQERNLDEENKDREIIPPSYPKLIERHSDKVIRKNIVFSLLSLFMVVVIFYLLSPVIVGWVVPWEYHQLVMGEIKDVMSIVFTPLCGALAMSLTFYYGANKGLSF